VRGSPWRPRPASRSVKSGRGLPFHGGQHGPYIGRFCNSSMKSKSLAKLISKGRKRYFRKTSRAAAGPRFSSKKPLGLQGQKVRRHHGGKGRRKRRGALDLHMGHLGGPRDLQDLPEDRLKTDSFLNHVFDRFWYPKIDPKSIPNRY